MENQDLCSSHLPSLWMLTRGQRCAIVLPVPSIGMVKGGQRWIQRTQSARQEVHESAAGSSPSWRTTTGHVVPANPCIALAWGNEPSGRRPTTPSSNGRTFPTRGKAPLKEKEDGHEWNVFEASAHHVLHFRFLDRNLPSGSMLRRSRGSFRFNRCSKGGTLSATRTKDEPDRTSRVFHCGSPSLL